MSLVINPNLMATNAGQSLGNSIASLADPGLGTTNDAGLRQIIRAEVIPLASADAQTPAAALETGTASATQGASAGTSETQAAAMAPEQQTGSILNTTDTGLTNLLAQAQMGMQQQNFQAQSGNVLEMMRSTPQTIGDRLQDPMMDPSLSALSPQWSSSEPLLRNVAMNSGSADQGVEALRSLFNVNA